MFSIILSVILVIILFIALGVDLTQGKWRLNIKQLLSVFGGIPILVALFIMVPANRVGVMFDPLNNGVQSYLLQEGLKIKAPYQTVYVLSTEVTEITFDNISVQTNDSQWLDTTLQIQVSVDKNKAFEYFRKHRNKELIQIQSILKSTTQRELEIITTSYNIMEILGGSRAEIVNLTFDLLEDELMKDGIILHRLILVDTDAGDTIEAAIALEAAAKKEAEAAQWLRIKAEEEGAAKVILAEKEKEANDILTFSLTEEILQKLRIDLYMEKWDGRLPQVVGGDGTDFIIDITG